MWPWNINKSLNLLKSEIKLKISQTYKEIQENSRETENNEVNQSKGNNKHKKLSKAKLNDSKNREF